MMQNQNYMMPRQRFANDVMNLLNELMDKVNYIGSMLEEMKNKETPMNETKEPTNNEPSEDELRAMALERLKNKKMQ